MEIEIKTPFASVRINNDNKQSEIINGKDRIVIGRIYYYLTKTIFLIPRLYGIIAKDPLVDWKNEFERQFTHILTNELTLAKLLTLELYFRITSLKMSITGSIQNGKVEAKVELKTLPEIKQQEDKIRSLVRIDSFYFSDINKKRPHIIPAIRAGLIASFYKFLPIKFEGAPGIPKTLGIISDFINSMVLPQGYSEEVLGHKIYIKDDEVYCDDNILYNADPTVLSLFPIVYFIKNSSENDIIVIEEHEVHLEEFKEILKEILNKSRAKLVLVSNKVI
uniref:Uncharacterized protein n=3 Tax=Saccharolobus solfataricus TaxID=2287 RepID=Q97VS1_SACS2|nr:hypothetical protein [Saccharolobus solfataricus]AAK42670.1 Hypothetical protein SSO2541 [Saccharolobus solfataricus P2]AKA72766.1 hypothetical protein SULB_0341 [Saccharolobus solfataricus]AKA75465.1 hypothetical protein SULC_0339 [Saccharolobus solfataricus]AKA78158.1 hypothetical protein SULA_0339 [Saccharolobus solfataricus]AZF67277.1 hypothetical protein SULG_01735 [Saccharolobus solfataricus]